MAKTSPTVQLSTRIDPEVDKALDAYAAKTGKTKTELVNTALRKLLKLGKT